YTPAIAMISKMAIIAGIAFFMFLLFVASFQIRLFSIHYQHIRAQLCEAQALIRLSGRRPSRQRRLFPRYFHIKMTCRIPIL
ncbi:MAG: hypothetical protein J5824_04740, partial [Lachnospiraceae bacterium]|nr:hypothetical protein [Lachnospiraceae bacterium]